MKTAIVKITNNDRQWFLIDAENVVLGRLATKVAEILRGKNKAFFSPHMDYGDYVIVINTDKIKVTGQKLADKSYFRHSGYPGGLKEVTLKTMIEKDSRKVVRAAVLGMMPKNKLTQETIKKLKLYKKGEHEHEAQKPVRFEIGERHGRK